MPGAVIILCLAVVIGVTVWIAAWRHTRNPSNHDGRADFRALQRHAAWLEQRLDLARRERWDPAMITSLSKQLGDACEALARARGGVIGPKAGRSARVR